MLKILEKVSGFFKKDEESKETIATKILEYLGGAKNIESLDACTTRIRVVIKDELLVADDKTWKKINPKAVIREGKNVQIMYGTKAKEYKEEVEKKL